MPREYENTGTFTVKMPSVFVFKFLFDSEFIRYWHPDFNSCLPSKVGFHVESASKDCSSSPYQFATAYVKNKVAYFDAYEIADVSGGRSLIIFTRRIVVPESGWAKWKYYLFEKPFFYSPVRDTPTIFETGISNAIHSQCVCLNCCDDQQYFSTDKLVSEIAEADIWSPISKWAIEVKECANCGIVLPKLPINEQWRLKAGLLEVIGDKPGLGSFLKGKLFKSDDPRQGLFDAIKSAADHFHLPEIHPEKVQVDLGDGLYRGRVTGELNKLRGTRLRFENGELTSPSASSLSFTTKAYLGLTRFEDEFKEAAFAPWNRFCQDVADGFHRRCVGCGQTYCRACSA